MPRRSAAKSPTTGAPAPSRPHRRLTPCQAGALDPGPPAGADSRVDHRFGRGCVVATLIGSGCRTAVVRLPERTPPLLAQQRRNLQAAGGAGGRQGRDVFDVEALLATSGQSLLASKADGRQKTRARGAPTTRLRPARLARRSGDGAGRRHGLRGHLPRGSTKSTRTARSASSVTSPPPTCPDPRGLDSRTFRSPSNRLTTPSRSRPVISAVCPPAAPPPDSRHALRSPVVTAIVGGTARVVARANASPATAAAPASRGFRSRRRWIDELSRLGKGEGEAREMYRAIATCLAAATVAAAGGTPLSAEETGAVPGAVTLGENGGSVRGAVILVVGSGALGLTDERGRSEIDVPAGSYEVLAQREHLTAARRTVTVEPGGTATADFVLEFSTVQEEVTVTASAGGTETGARGVQRRLDARCVRHRPGVGRPSRRCARGRAGHRAAQLRSGSEPADHPRVRRRPGADYRGRDSRRRPVGRVGRPWRRGRPQRRGAHRDRARAGDAAVRLERGRGARQRHHAAREPRTTPPPWGSSRTPPPSRRTRGPALADRATGSSRAPA